MGKCLGGHYCGKYLVSYFDGVNMGESVLKTCMYVTQRIVLIFKVCSRRLLW